MNPRLENRIGMMVFVGAGMTLFGFALPFLLGRGVSARTPIAQAAIPLIVLGVLILGGAAGIGLAAHSRSIRSKGEPKVHEQVRVMARFAIDGLGQMHFRDEDILDDMRLYLRLWFPDGTQDEFECAAPVFYTAGEGMWGSARIDGNWVGQFTPRPPPAQPQGNPYL